MLRELLLPARELLELRDRFVDFLLRRVERGRGLGLVLVLLEVHLELEELAQVAARSAAATAAALLERDLDVGEHRFGAQQMLQRLLLGRHGVLQLDLGEVVGRRRHRFGRLLEVVHELLDTRVDARELARARAVRERARLLGERALQLREHLRVVVQLLLVEIARRLFVALLDEVPGRDEDFLLPPRDLVLLLPAAAAAAAAALRRLREAAVERLHLDEVEVGLHLAAAILGDRVVRDHVAGLELAHRGAAWRVAARVRRGLSDAARLLGALLVGCDSRIRSRMSLMLAARGAAA